ncbi:hypothetical protein GF382_03920 [Candidatus Falkowbacteria bacterium]|nr:hypothetical protein [Candidatus Falkowbacteria bacterium]
MINLDDVNVYKKLDQGEAAESIRLLSDQIEQTWVDSKSIIVPPGFKKDINKVVVNGMGGSNLGFRIIRSVFKDVMKVPLIVEPGYDVPGFVDKNTLYIISSYSGNTEEPLSTYEKAKKKRARIMAITSKSMDNKLMDLIEKKKIPSFVFDPENNPSGQPRLGIGYSVFGAIRLLEKAGVLKVSSETAREVVAGIKGRDPFWNVNVKLRRNFAKRLAQELLGKIVVIVGSEFLEGNIHALRNQLSENGKSFSSYLISPDLNHFALEGLDHPSFIKDKFRFLFFNSDLYNEKTQKRNILIRQILEKKSIPYSEVNLKSRIKLAQSFEVLQFGSWLSFYMAILNGVDPSPIPWVDWFKDRLSRID